MPGLQCNESSTHVEIKSVGTKLSCFGAQHCPLGRFTGLCLSHLVLPRFLLSAILTFLLFIFLLTIGNLKFQHKYVGIQNQTACLSVLLS